MKDRTVSRRNFVGAFWGGILGILAFGYLHPVALPFGCFFGVVVGWWYQEVWQSVTDSFRRGVAGTQHAWNRFMTFVQRPAVLVQWMTRQVNRWYITRTLAVLAHLALNALWVVPLCNYCFNASLKGDIVSLLYILSLTFIIPVLVMILVILLPIMYISHEKRQKAGYVAIGPFRFLARDFVNLFRIEISMFLLMVGILIWFIGVGGAFLLLVAAPISVIVGVVKGIYEVSTRAGHWLCFGTTIIVTALAAWIAYPYLNDARALWTVALFAGLTSALVTEGLRRSLIWFFSISERARTIALATIYSQLAPSRRTFWQITRTAGNRFRDALRVPLMPV